jgi:hypothetical protein
MEQQRLGEPSISDSRMVQLVRETLVPTLVHYDPASLEPQTHWMILALS